MHFVYLLQSAVDQTFYIGVTDDVLRRLAEHNDGACEYTSKKAPWRLVYYEAYRHKNQAFDREKKLKGFGSAYTGLLKRLDLTF